MVNLWLSLFNSYQTSSHLLSFLCTDVTVHHFNPVSVTITHSDCALHTTSGSPVWLYSLPGGWLAFQPIQVTGCLTATVSHLEKRPHWSFCGKGGSRHTHKKKLFTVFVVCVCVDLEETQAKSDIKTLLCEAGFFIFDTVLFCFLFFWP